MPPRVEVGLGTGVIVFAGPVGTGLFRVSASGGASVPATRLDAATHETAIRLVTPASRSKRRWIDRAGKESETGMAAGPIGMLRLSHDGRRVAFRVEDRQARGDLWIHDLARRSRAASPSIPPMISTRSGHPTTRASCSARTEREAGTCTRSRPRGGAEELLFASEYRKSATDWSRYGRLVLFNQFGSTTRQDLWSLSLVDRKATVVLQTEFFESAGALSPDGRWIAYHSDESGRQEVYVQPFRGPGAKWRISREGGISARWRGDGKEIFFVTDDGKLMAVEVTTGATFAAGNPKLIFATRMRRSLSREYDATPDGQRFLVTVAPSDEVVPPITLVQNWQVAVKR